MRLPSGYIDKTDLRQFAKPLSLSRTPIHRWFVFPHSYSHQLVDEIIDAWGLDHEDRILDPFVGAGTTLVVAKGRGISAVGLDTSPLSGLASRVKISDYDSEALSAEWDRLCARMPKSAPFAMPHQSALVRRAFTDKAWGWLVLLREKISLISQPAQRELFQLAYLRAMREVCRAVSDGGWLRWTRRRPSGHDLIERMGKVVATMIADVGTESGDPKVDGTWQAIQGDARFPPKALGKVSAVICSPPYPNRHDYSRVFGPELLLAFCDEAELKQLRHTSFRSHVEAKDPGYPTDGYIPPAKLENTLRRLSKAPLTDPRVSPMVEGYFRDTFLTLRALRRHLIKGARLAFVVGNVRHAGVMVEVDEHLAQIAETLGYQHEESWVIRHRGNSAQQMEKFGRMPARESIVILRWQ